jgi:uncharacterized membrane protein YbjE (DUF340 family)
MKCDKRHIIRSSEQELMQILWLVIVGLMAGWATGKITQEQSAPA